MLSGSTLCASLWAVHTAAASASDTTTSGGGGGCAAGAGVAPPRARLVEAGAGADGAAPSRLAGRVLSLAGLLVPSAAAAGCDLTSPAAVEAAAEAGTTAGIKPVRIKNGVTFSTANRSSAWARASPLPLPALFVAEADAAAEAEVEADGAVEEESEVAGCGAVAVSSRCRGRRSGSLSASTTPPTASRTVSSEPHRF